jgi:hypothetical protein
MGKSETDPERGSWKWLLAPAAIGAVSLQTGALGAPASASNGTGEFAAVLCTRRGIDRWIMRVLLLRDED